jgi:hypothetical protein
MYKMKCNSKSHVEKTAKSYKGTARKEIDVNRLRRGIFSSIS